MDKHEITRLNNLFDKRIGKGDIYAETEKELFNLTLKFSLEDWAKVRSGDFWEKNDLIAVKTRKRLRYEPKSIVNKTIRVEQNNFLLKRVKTFLRGR